MHIHKKPPNRQNKKNITGKSAVKSTRARAINPEKNRPVDIKMSQISKYFLKISNGFPKDVELFANMVSSRNASSGRRVFANSIK
jgi:hypothetical protein